MRVIEIANVGMCIKMRKREKRRKLEIENNSDAYDDNDKADKNGKEK